MNRFVPLRHDSFKRLASQLKKKLGLRHCQALNMLSTASGFKDFPEVVASCRPDQSNQKPVALQYAGDLGFDVWQAQMTSVFGAEEVAEMGPKLRCWYRWTFEVGGDPAYSPPNRAEPDSAHPSASAPAAEASLPEAGCDAATLQAKTCSPWVVVTYRRRRRLIGEAQTSAMA